MLWYICLIISALIIAVTVPLFVRMRVFKKLHQHLISLFAQTRREHRR